MTQSSESVCLLAKCVSSVSEAALLLCHKQKGDPTKAKGGWGVGG